MHTNELLIKSMFRLIDAGRFTELHSTMAQEIVYERPGYRPRENLESVLHFYLCERQVEQGRHTIELVVGADDCAMAHGSFSGTTKSGLAIETKFSEVYQIRDGLVIFRRSYFFEPISIGSTSDNCRYL
jgi:ketosteroid isomerase-like protein